jgi:glycosyltransferase involved in cell wall biosynthesis
MGDRPLRVAVDARTLNTPHLRGIGKSVYELIRRTAASGAIDWHLFADRPDRPMQVPDGAGAVSVFETQGFRFHAWEQWSLPRAARESRADLLHAPGTSLPWWQPVPTIVTIHDTIPWQQRDGATTWDLYRDRVLPAAYHRAAAITTISQNSRKDILARWPALKPRLHVISPGVDERYLEAQPDWSPIVIDDRQVTEPYFLYFGGADPRKRLMWAMQAWWRGGADRSMLVVCGLEPGAHAEFRKSIPRELQNKVVLAPFLNEEDLPRIYMRATAVLYPSLYEGFGLPVVEAQSVGTPVVFSAVGSLGELNGPGAIVLPVDDLPAWARTVAKLLDELPARFGPDRIARAWARQYSWDAYVERTLAVYESVSARHPAPENRDHDVRQGATS